MPNLGWYWMKIFALIIGALLANSAAGQDIDCSSIKSDQKRLACYDKGDGGKKANASTNASVTKAGKPFKSHKWSVDETIDAMTDKKVCTAIYNNNWKIQASTDNFFISLKGRGGVSSYTLRFNDEPAGSQPASEIERSMSTVVLRDFFEKIYSKDRLRIQVFTVLKGLVFEDIDLTGFRDAVDYMRSNCGEKQST